MTLEDKLPAAEKGQEKKHNKLYSCPVLCGIYVTGMILASIAYVLYLKNNL